MNRGKGVERRGQKSEGKMRQRSLQALHRQERTIPVIAEAVEAEGEHFRQLRDPRPLQGVDLLPAAHVAAAPVLVVAFQLFYCPHCLHARICADIQRKGDQEEVSHQADCTGSGRWTPPLFV